MYEKSIRTYLKVNFSDFPPNYVDLELLAILALNEKLNTPHAMHSIFSH